MDRLEYHAARCGLPDNHWKDERKRSLVEQVVVLPDRKSIKVKITEYFAEDGHSRVPADYAQRWFMRHYDMQTEKGIKFRTANFNTVLLIAEEVMDW